MTATDSSNKQLSGGARGLLKDLVLLNEKTTAEMSRGVSEAYLDREGAIALAEKLGVEPPRVKRRFYRYFTRTHVYSFGIDAYTPEEATREAQRMQEINAGHGDMHYGDRSSFDREHGRLRAVFSTVTDVRPRSADVPNIHPWELERAAAEEAGTGQPMFRGRMNWESTVPR